MEDNFEENNTDVGEEKLFSDGIEEDSLDWETGVDDLPL